jgi:hypothetical protein
MRRVKMYQLPPSIRHEMLDGDMEVAHVVMFSDYAAIRNAALGVANALHVGTGAMIRGTMMEDELRKALGLKDGELWNFTTGKAEVSWSTPTAGREP